MSTPLGIGLAIDFARLDSDLAKVADKVDQVGARTTLKVGTPSGLNAAAKLDTAQLQTQVAQVGANLSNGLISGARMGQAAMVTSVARMEASLERLTGTTVTMFNRIDAAMKFPMWDASLSRMRLSLSNFAGGGKKTITDLDKALAGGFGPMIRKIASVFDALFQRLGKSMEGSMAASAENIGKAMELQATLIKSAFIDAFNAIAGKLEGLSVKTKAVEADAKGLMSAPGLGVTPPAYGQGFPTQTSRTGIGRALGKNILQPQLPAPIAKAMDFVGKIPQPAMLKAFLDILGKIPPLAFRSAAAVGTIVEGARPLVPVFNAISRIVFRSSVDMVRFGADMLNIVAIAAQAKLRWTNFFSSLGAVSKNTYSSLYRDHGIFIGSVLSGIKTLQHLYRGLVDIVTLRAFFRVGREASVFGQSVKAATGHLGRLTGSVGRLGVELLAAFGVVGVAYKIGNFFKQGVKGAADLNEKVAESKAVFGDATGAIVAQADKISRQYGVLRSEQVATSTQFGIMAQGAGISEKASAGLSNQLTELTLNFAAFKQIPVAEAAEKVRASLGGSGRALKQYGVFLDNAKVKGVALAEGVDLLDGEFDNEQTVMERARIIMNQLGYVMGSLQRTAAGASAQFRRAGGGLSEFGTRIGEVLMPAVTDATDAFNTFLAAVLDLTERNLPAITSWAATVREKVQGLGVVVRNFGDVWTIAGIKAKEYAANVTIALDTLVANMDKVFARMQRMGLGGFLKGELEDFQKGNENMVDNMTNIVTAAWDKITKGKPFAPTLVRPSKGMNQGLFTAPPQPGDQDKLKLPNFVSFQDEIEKVTKHMHNMEAAIPEPKPIPPPVKPPPLAEDMIEKGRKKKDEHKLAAAVEINSKEAAATIARTLSPHDKHDTAKSHLGVAKHSDSLLQKIATNTGIAAAAKVGGLAGVAGMGLMAGMDRLAGMAAGGMVPGAVAPRPRKLTIAEQMRKAQHLRAGKVEEKEQARVGAFRKTKAAEAKVRADAFALAHEPKLKQGAAGVPVGLMTNEQFEAKMRAVLRQKPIAEKDPGGIAMAQASNVAMDKAQAMLDERAAAAKLPKSTAADIAAKVAAQGLTTADLLRQIVENTKAKGALQVEVK